ncbi:MAG: hypothetical protein KJ732_05935 [Candidatus Margulisbacteria bacterium]|nr:hypothetical protein [Candidatus Margulisiibacteriota bacterium]
MGKKITTPFSCSKSLLLLSFLAILSLNSLSLADISSYEEQITKDYGPEYFFAIQGEVMGQAAPGVKSVKVNGQPVAIDPDLNFKARVTLKDGQKYLTIETLYKGLRFTKKYLVIRHPKAPKTFKITIPQQEFKKIVTRKEPVSRKRVVRREPAKKPKPKPKPKGSFGFKAREFNDPRYNVKDLAAAIEKDNYGFKLSSAKGSLKWLNELLRQPGFYDVWKKNPKHQNLILSADVKRLIKETAKYRHKPFNKLTRAQQLKIIRLNRLLLEVTYPLLCPKSSLFGISEEDENWLGFEFVAELTADKYLVVRKVNGKFFALIYDLRSKAWIPLHEISQQELFDLLEEGTVPLFIQPKK